MSTTENEVPAPASEEKVEKPQEENSTASPPTENNISAAEEDKSATAAAAPEAESTPAEDKKGDKEEVKSDKENDKAENADKEVKEDGKTEKAKEEPPAPEPHVVEAEDLFKKLSAAENCQSLLHKHLTQAVLDKIKGKKTSQGGTLADCIKSEKAKGCKLADISLKVYAIDLSIDL
ncbi:arginine kinase [Elysia marginata]|uniref:Arginine kinase n=1 Tax=Elysia marginata TaxID=1093978 RepID=A0AAV4HKR8_9GAST|nr:arginine kinase [Elysia marginata]